jgi:hypothetical protein
MRTITKKMVEEVSQDMVMDFDPDEIIDIMNSMDFSDLDEDDEEYRQGKTLYMRGFLKRLFDSWESYQEFQHKDIFNEKASAKDKHEAMLIVAMNNKDEVVEVLEKMELENE